MGRRSRAKARARAEQTATLAALSKGASARVLLHNAGDGWTGKIEGARDLAQRIGPDMFACFLRCFHGVDRLLALEQLLYFNSQLAAEGSVAKSFNLRFLVNLIAATMYEIASALNGLSSARIDQRINDVTKWEPVNALRKTWVTDERLKLMRNSFGAHLGYLADYKAGLDRMISDSDTLDLIKSDGSKRHGTEFVLSTEVLLAGLQIEEDDMHEMIRLTSNSHDQLPDLLYSLWKEVLDTAGVPVVETSRRPREPKDANVRGEREEVR